MPSRDNGKNGNGGGRGTINRTIQDRIGEQLRAMYDDLKEEPVPDHLLEVLKQLDKPQSDEG